MSPQEALLRYRGERPQKGPTLGDRMDLAPIPLAGHRIGDLDEADLDERLAIQSRTGLAAFGPLYQRHRDSVFRYLRSRGCDEDAAAELTAIAFERALGAIARYRRAGGGFTAWMLRIARNAAIDAARSRRWHDQLDQLAEGRHPRSSDTPEGSAIAAEDRRYLASLLAQLPELQRDALALRYANGLTSREIGVVIGKSEAATKKLLTRALAALKESHHDA